MQQGDTICAVATAKGEGGIGIIRISGNNAQLVAAKVFRAASGKDLAEYKSYQAVYGHIVASDGKIVDEAIALIMRGPHSYT